MRLWMIWLFVTVTETINYTEVLFYSRHDLYLHYILIKKLTIIFSLYVNKFFLFQFL